MTRQRPQLDTRGRLTLPGIARFVGALACLAALAPILFAQLDTSAVGTGTSLIFQMVTPVAVIVLFAVLYVNAVGGGK